jgi:16S rRNA (adenine1518-N6/adenine1519-N6)-dimethyltransferase
MNVRHILDLWKLQPERGLGQNFLIDPNILRKIVAAADIQRSDVILEVGAGVGNLTELLVSAAGHVVAVELDRRLIPVLEENLLSFNNVTLVHGDILDLNPASLVSGILGHRGHADQYKVVANLPYYITSAVLRHLLEASLKPACLIVTVQHEVAKRIVAQPGDMSVLAVSVQFYGRPKILFRIKPGSFYPEPSVNSAVLRIDLYPTPPVPVDDPDILFRVVNAGFSQRRKQLHNTLAAGLGISSSSATELLERASVDPRRRAETLSVEEWGDIACLVYSAGIGGNESPR